ncbi:MAG: TIM-barrel domain-containing protein [Gammaproteobacteria bacterium]
MPFYPVIACNGFTPNLGQWTSVGTITGFTQTGNVVNFQMQSGPAPQLTILSATLFRVRFNPAGNYSSDNSNAVVNKNLGAPAFAVNDLGGSLEIQTGALRIVINKSPWSLAVFRFGQLIHADTPTYNLVYIPGQEVIANFKVYPANARYFGLGEKAGAALAKNEFSTTFINYDNFTYHQGPGIPGDGQNCLNPQEPLYCSIPFLIENNPNPVNGGAYSYGLLFDNPAQTFFNIGASDYSNMFGKYYFGALFGELDYYFMYGAEVSAVLSQYTALTGRSPMPPRYVFGYHQGAYGYYKDTILQAAAQNYRNARIPIDGLHIDVDFQNNYRTFTSSDIKFPNAPQLMAQLHNQGFRCSTNITPLVNHYGIDETGNIVDYPALSSGEALAAPGEPPGAFIYNTRAGGGPDPDKFIGTVDYGNNPGLNPVRSLPLRTDNALRADGFYPDIGRASVRKWWGEQYDYLINTVGLDMIWQDMTCPALQANAVTPDRTLPLDLMMSTFSTFAPNAKVHNSYVINLLQATYDGVAKLRPGKRVFIIARGGYAGMQRYAGLWTGDSSSSWDFLSINIPEVLNLGLSGVPISGCDIGGFATDDGPNSGTTSGFFYDPTTQKIVGGVTSPQLLMRWMIVGAFLPWYRNHYNGYNKAFQEPYAYGEPVPSVCRYIVGLRYRLFPLFYSAMYECTQSGMPIARPLFLNDSQDLNAYNFLNDQFFVGRDFLVAPVVTQSDTRNVYLPAGSQWYAYMDNRAPLGPVIEGGTLVTNWRASLDGDPQFTVPLYVRAGAILPTCELQQFMGQLTNDNPITFNVYPGADGSFTLYQDDGETTAAENTGAFRLTTISHQGIPGGQRVRVLRTHDNFAPPTSFYFVSFVGTNPPVTVTRAGTALPNVGAPDPLFQSGVDAYYYNASLKTTFLKIFDASPDVALEVTF